MALTNYRNLRQKYPVFSYDKFDYLLENNSLVVKFYYSAGDHKFAHKLSITNIEKLPGQIDKYIFNVGLSILPSYWKLFCSPTINIQAGTFPATPKLGGSSEGWWQKLFIKGMGEYFYKNQIIFTEENFLSIKNKHEEFLQTGAQGVPPEGKVAEHPQLQNSSTNSNKTLVPVGGGKDSIVTLELLKSHYDVTAFVINPVPLISEVIKKAGVPSITVENIFDPELFELNRTGYLNGHVPVSAFYAFTAVLTAYLHNISYVAFSNERSSGEGNTNYLGQEINHQYSKTLEFETDLNIYLRNITNIKYFSFLRPIYELQITKIFSQYPQYFDIFSSCNQNFKQNRPATPKPAGAGEGWWCQNCPKCVSTALMLACFLGEPKVAQIMGTFPNNPEILNQLTGVSPVKPFECVLTRAEAIAATTGQGFENIINSWQDNPNMPEEFSKILKSVL